MTNPRKPSGRRITDTERKVISAALKENSCRCRTWECKHLYDLWDSVEKLAASRKRGGR